MAIRNVVKVGDDILRKMAKPVDEFGERLWQLLDDMAETMYMLEGVGLAANQVGILKRAFVVDIGEGLFEFINPEIIRSSGEQIGAEGCLSVENRQGDVCRPNKVKVRAMDRYGNEFTLTASDYFARAICHENDHLNGILFIDKLMTK